MILRVLHKVNIKNGHVIPQKGPFIIACTHTGWVDVLQLGTSLLPLEIHYMAKKELFNRKLTSILLKKLNAFPVDRDNPGPSTLKIPNRLLADGKIVGIFPSGTRTDELSSLKQGAIAIAQRNGVPVIPVIYKGPNNVKELLFKREATLIFQEPIVITTKDKKARENFTNVLEERLTKVQY